MSDVLLATISISTDEHENEVVTIQYGADFLDIPLFDRIDYLNAASESLISDILEAEDALIDGEDEEDEDEWSEEDYA
jgi:hypothetical protein